jgi:uncharacterized coiled-coil DUF342 family protein
VTNLDYIELIMKISGGMVGNITDKSSRSKDKIPKLFAKLDVMLGILEDAKNKAVEESEMKQSLIDEVNGLNGKIMELEKENEELRGMLKKDEEFWGDVMGEEKKEDVPEVVEGEVEDAV